MVSLRGAQEVASAARRSNLDRKDCFASLAMTRSHLWGVATSLANTFFRECTPVKLLQCRKRNSIADEVGTRVSQPDSFYQVSSVRMPLPKSGRKIRNAVDQFAAFPMPWGCGGSRPCRGGIPICGSCSTAWRQKDPRSAGCAVPHSAQPHATNNVR